jgi:hypothetical protein
MCHWLEEDLMAVLTAYADDSSDKERTVLAIGCLWGLKSIWTAFKEEWGRLNPIPFHATDCESGFGDFAGISPEQNRNTYRQNAELLAGSRLYGISFAIDSAYFRGSIDNLPEDHEYYVCLGRLLRTIAALGKLHKTPYSVHMIYDQHADREFTAGFLYDCIRKQSSFKPLFEHLNGNLEFADYRVDSGVQVADLLAREAMKDFLNQLAGSPRARRKSFVCLDNTHRFKWETITRAEIDEIRGAEMTPAISADIRDSYRKWMTENRRSRDTMSSRLHFLHSINPDFLSPDDDAQTDEP